MPSIMATGHNNTIGHRPKLLILSTNSDLVSSPLPVGTPLEHIILVFPICECFVQSACTLRSLNFHHIVTPLLHQDVNAAENMQTQAIALNFGTDTPDALRRCLNFLQEFAAGFTFTKTHWSQFQVLTPQTHRPCILIQSKFTAVLRKGNTKI